MAPSIDASGDVHGVTGNGNFKKGQKDRGESVLKLPPVSGQAAPPMAVALGNPIFSAQVGTWSNAGQGNPFLTAWQANGRVHAPGCQRVQVFGLTP